MIDDDIIKASAVKQTVEIVKKLVAQRRIYGVKQNLFLVINKISITRITTYGVNVLKKRLPSLIYPYPIDIFRYLFYTFHMIFLS